MVRAWWQKQSIFKILHFWPSHKSITCRGSRKLVYFGTHLYDPRSNQGIEREASWLSSFQLCRNWWRSDQAECCLYAETYLAVFRSNYFLDGPQDISVSGSKTGLEGEQILLSCLTDANPSPSITWYKISKSAEVLNAWISSNFVIPFVSVSWIWSKYDIPNQQVGESIRQPN